ALGHGIGTFIVAADDPTTIQRLGQEVAPAVREVVAAERASVATPEIPADTPGAAPATDRHGRVVTTSRIEEPGDPGTGQYGRLGVPPTPDDGARRGATRPWDETTRPRRAESGPEVTYTRRGAQVGKHLIDVHDMLRDELDQV